MKLTTFFNHYAFLLSIILFTILPVKSQINNVLTFNETTKGGNLPRVFAMDKFDDNTIIVHTIRRNSIPTQDRICVDDLFTFHAIFPDGKSKAVVIKLPVQAINYCIYDVNKILYNPIKIYTMRTNFILVTYTEAEDETNVNTYMEYAIIIDLGGKIHGKILLGPSFVDVENRWIPNKAKIKLNVNREKGFVRVGPITNTTNALLQQFVV
ncbi:15243_t:CDS:2 [Funneliformis mosseae]|uniref:15243_t:CDS:1 n=1 Tax=Funneliformis mosseae TaxID=27381 RepID=A0A9N9E4L0_FUNMO|nr:15243_t:CDS:2 [Funneliformis mosseae]